MCHVLFSLTDFTTWISSHRMRCAWFMVTHVSDISTSMYINRWAMSGNGLREPLSELYTWFHQPLLYLTNQIIEYHWDIYNVHVDVLWSNTQKGNRCSQSTWENPSKAIPEIWVFFSRTHVSMAHGCGEATRQVRSHRGSPPMMFCF